MVICPFTHHPTVPTPPNTWHLVKEKFPSISWISIQATIGNINKNIHPKS